MVRVSIPIIVVMALAWFLVTPAVAGIVVEEKPASLLSHRVIMEQGVPCIPMADFARALGGTYRTDLNRRLVKITPGTGGQLQLNAARLRPPTSAAGRPVALLQLNGSAVPIGEYERLMLRTNPLMPLPLLGRLLGGEARLDPRTQQWLLPGGSNASGLAFR